MATALDTDFRPPEAADIDPDERDFFASGPTLVWRRFKRHRMALIGTVLVAVFYLFALFSEFFAIHDPRAQFADRAFVPPQPIHFDGLRPFVYGITSGRDPETLMKVHVPDISQKYYLRLFARGFEYELWGLFGGNIHLVGVVDGPTEGPPAPLYPLGSDRMGRDMWSRIIYGTRISTSIGLVGVALSLFLGLLIGGLSGYRGGRLDVFIQRLIEQIRALPTIPLWLALAAAVPQDWSIIKTYFAITVILSVVGWTTLAREVRGRFLQMRNDDFITAARMAATGELKIIFQHMVPSFMSHVIAVTTLAIPGIIIAETSLSFLGLGMRQPAISWGVLLQEAQNIQSVALAPWLLLPGVMVILAVLSFNFMGDGLRDAADPYGSLRK